MTNNFKTILVKSGVITEIILNRPDVHNAMNVLMINELTKAFGAAYENNITRLIILKGNGKSFCAGADLNYMKEIARFGFNDNFEDGKKLAFLFKTIYQCPVPTIAVVHGAAFGGANGLIAACDIAIAELNTTFSFSEVKLGIGPATISPYIIKRIGEYQSRDLLLTGRKFKGEEAQKTGLINWALPLNEIETRINNYIKEFKSSAPKAVKYTKQIISKITGNSDTTAQVDYTAKCIAELRGAEEGQEGMSAFLEKRKPNWIIEQ
jgi:methylglutaconyl-CoA hydratase